MATHSFAHKFADTKLFRHFPRYTGATVVLFGLLIIASWYAHWRPILQMLPNSSPMQYNTALCFILSGAGLFLLTTSRAKIAPWLGGAVFLFTLLTLLQYVAGRDLGIDQIFFKPYFQVNRINPGRMSPLAAVCFIFIGAAVVLAGAKKQWSHRLAGTGSLSCIVATIVGVALFGYVLGIEAASGWGAAARMAVNTAIAFLLLSSGLFVWSWQRSQAERFNFLRWVPVIGSVTLMLMIGLVSIASLAELKNAIFWRGHTYQVLIAAGSFVGSLTDMQRGMRGYVLTTSPEALELYRSATNSAPHRLGQLAEMTRDNPSQMPRLKTLTADLDAIVAYSRELIGARDGQGLSAAVQLEKSGRGLAVMNQAIADVEAFTNEEQRLLIQRDAAAAANFNNTARLFFFGSVLAAGLLVLANFMASLEVKLRRQSEDALQESEVRVRLATESAGIAVWEWDTRSGAIHWDEQMFAIYGMVPTPGGWVTYQDWSGRVLPEDLAEQEEELKHTAATGGRSQREFRIVRTSDRAVRFIQAAEMAVAAAGGQAIRVVGINLDITARKQTEAEREKLIGELQAALSEVKTLSGMIPICGWCKKVRSDQGYWQSVEQYIGTHSDATFSHGMCPECAEKFKTDILTANPTKST